VKAAESFGTVAVAGLGSSAGIATRTQGLALGVAWRRRDWTLDLGTSPLGFEITRLTGGIRYSPKVGVLDLSVEAFRRPVTSSLLSYAGRTDPASGRRFGGVTDNGVALRLGRYEADASVSLSLRQSSLTGTSVASNTHTSARVAADRTLFHPLGGELTLGTVLTYDSYARNLLAYTFGSAGYFSPQSYSTLTVPVEWVRESAEAAWRVRLTPTLTHRHDASAEQYPTDPAAMAALLALGGNPLISGGSVSAASIGINIDYERRVHGGVIGIGFFHDRADYYRPISLQVYFRPGSVKGARFAALRPIMDY
jgi:hypothetical protein